MSSVTIAKGSDKLAQHDPALRLRALLGLIATCALWGVSFPVMKALALLLSAEAPGISTWFVAASTVVLRFGFGALLLVLTGYSRPTKQELTQGCLIGVFSAAGMLLQMDALNFCSASTGAFLTQGYIVILPLVAALSGRVWPSAKTIVCVCVSTLGLGLLSGFDWVSLRLGRGETETLLAACAFALQILFLDHRGYRKNRSRVVTQVMFVCVALALAPIAFGAMRTPAELTLLFSAPMPFGLLFVLCVPCTVLAFSWMNRYQPQLSASEAGIVYGAEPLFASLLSLFLPGIFSSLAAIHYANEALTSELLWGGGLVIAANVLLQLPWSFGILRSGAQLGSREE
ncbi:MAG TPA: EamA family transporter [Polyangiaceae bacterium]|nr:EamA family transporter [Polyangiaceae bacterium]